MDNAGIWIAIAVGAVLLGLVRPRWLVTLLIVLFAVVITGLVGVFILVLVGKFFGNGKK